MRDYLLRLSVGGHVEGRIWPIFRSNHISNYRIFLESSPSEFPSCLDSTSPDRSFLVEVVDRFVQLHQLDECDFRYPLQRSEIHTHHK